MTETGKPQDRQTIDSVVFFSSKRRRKKKRRRTKMAHNSVFVEQLLFVLMEFESRIRSDFGVVNENT